jgi:hypothetical protein
MYDNDDNKMLQEYGRSQLVLTLVREIPHKKASQPTNQERKDNEH